MTKIRFGALAALLAACDGNHRTGDAGWSGHADAFAMQVDDLRAGMQEHQERIDACRDLMEVWAEETRHMDEADVQLAEMRHQLVHMGECEDDGGMHPDMDEMMASHDECEDEMEAHAAAMADAPDLEAASIEEARHHSAMDERLGEMDQMGRGMMSMGGMDCPEE